MDWLSVFKSKTYGKLRFSLYVFTIIILLYLVSLFVNYVLTQNKIPEQIIIFIVGLLTWWVLQVPIPIFTDFTKKIASLSPSSRIIHLLPKDNLSNLIWHGDVGVVDSTNLRVAQTDRGILFRNVYWKDFIAVFNFKFEELIPVRRKLEEKEKEERPKENFVGFIFRAQDLDNYFMLQLGLEVGDAEKKIVFFRPHVRINGNWEAVQHTFYDYPFNENGFNKVKCVVRKMKLSLELNDKMLGEWNLPSHSSKKTEDEKNILIVGDSTSIPFRNCYGKIGFRASHGENALIKDIKVIQL